MREPFRQDWSITSPKEKHACYPVAAHFTFVARSGLHMIYNYN